MNEFHSSTLAVVQKGQIVEHRIKTNTLGREPGWLNKGIHHLTVSNELETLVRDSEQFLYGALVGMSGTGQPVCVNSLRLSIYYGFQVFQYREIYLPQNTMKAQIVGNKLTESGNKVFTYCDFTHLWTVVSSLGFNMNSLGNWGSLGARVTGSLFQDMWKITKNID
jgi:hypothetical protein